eukprot:7099844-Prorocentrum_lima.AAC.1
MTSSLVGSEMCIRDRGKHRADVRCKRATEARWAQFRRNKSREETRGSKPVSYTHLTLPTICSV